MRGDLDALEERSAEISRLFREEHRALLRLAVLLVGDAGVAEDVVQDAFASLQRRWNSLSDHATAAGYLRVSVINGARSLRRRWAVARRHPHIVDSMTSPAADTRALLAEEHRAVVAAVGRLPRRQQQVIILRYWSDMSEAQIAQALAISTGTVKSSASRALVKLAQELGVDHVE